jgi:alkanesulfonate monooxygenase SsuD/methylene tetrahydromethanopterin reductase-like flavin-dependent oxidoreductase (luciferase family)
MRLHLVFQPDTAENLARYGALAEELGFEGVWVANMASARSPYLALSLLARATRRIRLGPAAISPFEEHPLKIAGSLLALNEFAAGRAHVAIGGGGGTLIGMGLKPQRASNYPRMVRGVRECVEFLRLAAEGRPFDYVGEIFRVQGYAPLWVTGAPPRFYVAANKPQMLRLAGEIADGVMLSDIDLPFLDGTLGELRTGLARAARERAGFRVNNLIAWHVKEEREAARLEARRNLWVRGIWERARLEPYLDADECDLVQRSLPAWQRAYAAGSAEIPGVPQRIVDTIADHLTLTGDHGDLGRLTGRLRAISDAGVDEVSLRLYDDPAASIRLIAERVAPALQED